MLKALVVLCAALEWCPLACALQPCTGAAGEWRSGSRGQGRSPVSSHRRSAGVHKRSGKGVPGREQGGGEDQGCSALTLPEASGGRVTGLGPYGFPCAACGEIREQVPSHLEGGSFLDDDRPSDGTYFTKSQLIKNAPRCAACVRQDNPAAADFCAPTGWRRCTGVKHRVWCSGESFAGPGAPVCTACLESEELQRATVERKARLPKSKIKDVQLGGLAGFPCAACGELRHQMPSLDDGRPSNGTYFTKSQLTKDAPRCAACVDQENPAAADFRAPTGWRRCRANKHRVWCSKDSFAGPGLAFCTACKEFEELRRANAGCKARLPKSGLSRQGLVEPSSSSGDAERGIVAFERGESHDPWDTHANPTDPLSGRVGVGAAPLLADAWNCRLVERASHEIDLLYKFAELFPAPHEIDTARGEVPFGGADINDYCVLADYDFY
ncbi:hypothetical protein T484DRAFT_1792754 [Baffinella frigidus]|nr:hypothetical protein T484DRAFT_1792754 [Cryptophyta sp. CCMP2293]